MYIEMIITDKKVKFQDCFGQPVKVQDMFFDADYRNKQNSRARREELEQETRNDLVKEALGEMMEDWSKNYKNEYDFNEYVEAMENKYNF